MTFGTYFVATTMERERLPELLPARAYLPEKTVAKILDATV